MISVLCSSCGSPLKRFPSQVAGREIFFCNKSCHRTYKNKVNNPSWTRDLSGENNPMYGKSNQKIREWNEAHKGENSPQWRGGLHKRKDGYYRLNMNGKRYLYHRVLMGVKDIKGNVVHHIDHDPSNNNPNNLMIFESQAEHVKYEKCESSSGTKNSSGR